MKYCVFLFTLLFLFASSLFAVQDKKEVDYVNPMIGTNEHGHTYPGATVPFGMVQLSPDAGKAGWDWCSSYHYSDTAIAGFSHTHLSGTGCADLGDILVVPSTSTKCFDTKYRIRFSHTEEHAEAGYYKVALDQNEIQAELTATERVGFHRYTFTDADSVWFAFNLGHGNEDMPSETFVKIESDRELTGYRFSSGWANNQKLFFAAEFSEPFVEFCTGEKENLILNQYEAKNKYAQAAVRFSATKNLTVLLKVGISYVSVEGAKNNLKAEISHWDFDKTRLDARKVWQNELSKISIVTKSTEDKITFYSALYHCFLAPTLFCDADGTYRGADDSVHFETRFKNYCTFSLWDTFRAEHPLFTIVQPDRVDDMIESMLAFYREGGLLPIWNLTGCETNCMIGYHSIPVIVDAYLKGFRGFDAKEAYAAMKKSAFQSERGLRYYNATAPVSFEEQIGEMKNYAKSVTPSLKSDEFSESSCILNGYAKTDSGEVIHYWSAHSSENRNLLSRATDGKMEIAWETEVVPADCKSKFISVVWLAGLCTRRDAHKFTLWINGIPYIEFNTSKDESRHSFRVEGKAETILAFQSLMIDRFNDLFGNMYLKIPRKLCKPGEPLKLQIVGEAADNRDWVMTTQYSLSPQIVLTNEYGIAEEDSQSYQFIRAEIEHFDKPFNAVVYAENGKRVSTRIEIGLNTLYLPVPLTKESEEILVSVESNNKLVKSQKFLLKPIQTYGYIPADKEKESVSKTLEYAYDDWCIAQMARAMDNEKDYKLFTERSEFYKNIYDPTTGFMRGRNLDGSWVTPFNPAFSTAKQPEYTEGNAWQYSWFVPHDVDALISLMGGKEKFTEKLDSLFVQKSGMHEEELSDITGLIGLYAHGNEPSHHIVYLYNYVNQPWKTQEKVSHILQTLYHSKADGLCGNEDCGQMSAWYVLSALGFYPVNPAEGLYQIGSPRFEKSFIRLPDNKLFTINAKNNSDKNIYLKSAMLNGRNLLASKFSHQDIVKGGKLDFVMSNQPNYKLWTTETNSPP